MTAYLTYPSSGSIYVDPLTEILISFENIDARKEYTNIKVDGEWAVIEGVVQDGFTHTRFSFYNGIMQWGLRKRGGLASRDILISAWCATDCATVEQRFYVRGAQYYATTNHRPGERWCRTLGGVFSTPDGRPFPDRIAINNEGKITKGGRAWFVPQGIVNHTMDLVSYEGSWLLASSDSRKTYIARPNRLHVYDFPSQQIAITGGFINLQIDECTSAHLPTHYQAASTETSLSDWFTFSHEGEWNMIFGQHSHIWWNKEKFITKHSPRPITGVSDDMLWTSKDIKSDIHSITAIDGTHVLVNESLYIDTYHPEITRIK